MSDHVEKWTLEDGRKAEKRIVENVNQSELTSEKVVELHMEDERPLKLKQRITEKTKPVICERKIETIDAHGNVVEVKIEASEPQVKMQVVEHIGVANVGAQSHCKTACKKSLTKDDVFEVVRDALASSRVNECHKINSLGLADQIEEKVNDEEKSNKTVNNVLVGIIVVLTAGLGYLLFAM
jgi:hypothetical protein